MCLQRLMGRGVAPTMEDKKRAEDGSSLQADCVDDKGHERRHEKKGGRLTDANAYWGGRQDYLYYQVIRILVRSISNGSESIIDVGSAGCHYLEWFDHVPHRTSVDLTRPYVAPGINSFTGDFLKWEPDRKYDVAICLQVLEHIPPIEDFVKKLVSVGKTVVISVPYKWEAGRTPSHVNDPVDEEKLRRWFGREPNFSTIVTELVSPVQRLICVYDPFPNKWRSLNHRQNIVNRLREAEAQAVAGSPAPQPAASA